MPTLMKKDGFRFFFFSKEDHEPPHIHIEHAEKYAKCWLEPIALARSRDFRLHEITTLLKLVKDNREFFLKKWHEYFNSKN